MEPPAGTSSTALKKIDNLGRNSFDHFCPPRLTRLKFQEKRNEDQFIQECRLSLQKKQWLNIWLKQILPYFPDFLTHLIYHTITPIAHHQPKKRLNSGNLTRHHWIQRLNQCLSDWFGWEATGHRQPLLMVQKSGDHQLRLVVHPIVYRLFWYISGGYLGFLNHQQ